MKKLLMACFISGVLPTAASAAVVFSENWDSYDSLVPTSTNFLYYPVNTSNGGLAGWSINNVDLSRAPNYGAISGISVDLNGLGLGGVSANFATTPGVTYTVTFDRSFNGSSAGSTPPVNVYFGEFLPTSVFYFAGVGSETQSYTATGSVGFLAFISGGSGTGGSVIDNIVVSDNSVAAIPEPGEWAMMLFGLGIVGTIAKRRRAIA
jgi:hypothetical protein